MSRQPVSRCALLDELVAERFPGWQDVLNEESAARATLAEKREALEARREALAAIYGDDCDVVINLDLVRLRARRALRSDKGPAQVVRLPRSG